MKKFFALSLIVVFCFVSCKKSEEQKASESKPQAKPAQGPRPGALRAKKKKAGPIPPLEIYNEGKLVTSVPPEQYSTLAVSKVKVGRKEMPAVLLSDLLKQHNLSGKSVIFSGRGKTAQISWEEATKSKMYVYITPRKNLQLYDADKGKRAAKIPLLERITVTQKVESAATPVGKKPAT